METSEPFRIAAVQAAPVFLDLAATLDKACDLIQRAAAGSSAKSLLNVLSVGGDRTSEPSSIASP